MCEGSRAIVSVVQRSQSVATFLPAHRVNQRLVGPLIDEQPTVLVSRDRALLTAAERYVRAVRTTALLASDHLAQHDLPRESVSRGQVLSERQRRVAQLLDTGATDEEQIYFCINLAPVLLEHGSTQHFSKDCHQTDVCSFDKTVTNPSGAQTWMTEWDHAPHGAGVHFGEGEWRCASSQMYCGTTKNSL
jgi:hypothetical protein